MPFFLILINILSMGMYFIPPDGFSLFGFEIKFYGLIMAFSMLLGIILASLICKKRGMKSDDIVMLALIMLPCAVIGARIYYCLFFDYNYTFKDLFNLRQGGLAIYGGIIGGIIGIIIFCLIKKKMKLVPVVFDIVVPCLILGQVLGRWGNFFNQEAYGNLITNPKQMWFPFAVFIETEQAWYQATFFYESLWNFVGLFILLAVYYKTRGNGLTTASYLIWEGIGRMWIEGLRSDSLYIKGTNIRVSQMLSGVMLLVGLGIVLYHVIVQARRKKNGQKV